MSRASEMNFVRQQGFLEASPADCDLQYPALMWQPRLIGVILVIALITQEWRLFLGLAAILWWNAILPRWNPFDALYNILIARRRGAPPLAPSPAPRRFAQGMAATFCLGIAAALRFSMPVTAYVLEGLLAVALAALIFGRFCLGSYVYHLTSGSARFANRTLPWSRGG